MNTSQIGSPPSKIRLLNERWQQIQQQIDRQKHFRSHSLQQHLLHLQDKLTSSKNLTQQKVQVLNAKISKLKEEVQSVNDHREEMSVNAQKRLARTQEQLQKEIQAEKASRIEHTNNWIRRSDQKLLDVCNSMETITSEKGDTVQTIAIRVKNKLAALEASLEEEKKRREEECGKITVTIEEELNKMYGELEGQKKVRQQNGRKVTGMLRDIQQKLEAELEEERKLRKQTNSSLLFLLEQTCNKVEKAFE